MRVDQSRDQRVMRVLMARARGKLSLREVIGHDRDDPTGIDRNGVVWQYRTRRLDRYDPSCRDEAVYVQRVCSFATRIVIQPDLRFQRSDP